MYLGASCCSIVLIVLVNDAERRLPVQYSKRVVGRKMYGGQSTHLPMKVNMSGVMPIIFAQSIASLPATIGAFVPDRCAEQLGCMRICSTPPSLFYMRPLFPADHRSSAISTPPFSSTPWRSPTT